MSLIGDAESCCETPCDCCNDEIDFMILDVDFVISSFDNPEIKTIDLFADSFILLNSAGYFEFYSNNAFRFYPDISPPKDINHLSFFQSFLC